MDAIDSPSSAPPTLVTSAPKSRLRPTIALHGRVFQTDPVINYLCHTLPAAKRHTFIPDFLHVCLKSASINGAQFDEAWTSSHPPPSGPESGSGSGTQPSPACSAVWVPPRTRVDAPVPMLRSGFLPAAWKLGVSGLRRIFGQYMVRAGEAKEAGLVHPRTGEQVRGYWYLFYIATDEAERGKGLGGRVIRNFVEDAGRRGEGVPVWLEATTEASRRLYDRLGFKDVSSWRLGVGEVDEYGVKKVGGAGIQVWGMVWWPPENEDVAVELSKGRG